MLQVPPQAQATAESKWVTSSTQDTDAFRYGFLVLISCKFDRERFTLGCQELMLKEAAWTAKFIRRQREEEAEELKTAIVPLERKKQVNYKFIDQK